MSKKDFYIIGNDAESIDYYIEAFASFNKVLAALINKAPETRKAILNANYIDVLTLRAFAYEAERLTNIILDTNTLRATQKEVIEMTGILPEHKNKNLPF